MKFNKFMDDVKKMLRSIITGQSAMKQELLAEIKKVDNKLSNRIESLEAETKEGFRKVNKRLDIIGKSVAFLEDDAPTREEHDELKRHVTKIESKLQV